MWFALGYIGGKLFQLVRKVDEIHKEITDKKR